MTTYISNVLRLQVKESAGNKCDYCLIADDLSAKRHEVDHIYAEKHGGATIFSNLCLSCYYCNRHKGSDLCSIDRVTGELVSLFHPRRNQLQDHFTLNGKLFEGKTPVGRVTVELLQMNIPERIKEREILIRLNKYP